MADVLADPATAQKPAEGAPSSEVKTETLTRAEAEALITGALEKQRNAIFAEIRRNSKAPEVKAPAAQEPDSLASKVERLSAQSKALAEEKKRTTLETAFVKPFGERAEKAAKYVLALHGDKIEVTDDFQVLYREGDDQKTPLRVWADAFLKTDEAEMFLPPKLGPSGDGLKPNTSGAPKAPHPFSKLSYSEIMEKARTNYAEYAAYVRDYGEEFKGKQRK